MATTDTATTPTPPSPATEPAPLERFELALPDFTRIAWVSDAARSAWEPRFEAIGTAWAEIEWRSVAAEVRPCAVLVVPADKLVECAGPWAEHGLCALPVELQGLSNYSYSSTPAKAVFGGPFAYRVAIGTPESVALFKRAWDASDSRAIGRLLGFPDCCSDFFERVWVGEGSVDTTWPMAAETPGAVVAAERELEIDGPPEANILWRWMGLRTVPHLPCSARCEPTAELGRALLEVGEAAGFGEEMELLREVLRWPVEWSALHGIAEVKTPLLKVSTRTDATPFKYVVRRPGSGYPDEGARGLRFPYRVAPVPDVEVERFRRGLENPIADAPELPAWYASDNGFSSTTAMDAAHSAVVELALRALAGGGGWVVDLGCGNGALLRKLGAANARVRVRGVELDVEKAAHARTLLGEDADGVVVGDMFSADWARPDGERYALALLMPGRLVEAGAERAARFRTLLQERCERILVYAYGDWLERFGSLSRLAAQVGLQLVGTHGSAGTSLAEVAS